MLHRRRISKELQNRGWVVKTTVDGWVDVQVLRRASVEQVAQQVRTAVEALGYTPTVVVSNGGSLIRLRTPETLQQAGQGAHGFVATPRPSSSFHGAPPSEPIAAADPAPALRAAQDVPEPQPMWATAFGPGATPTLTRLSAHSDLMAWHVEATFEELRRRDWPARWSDERTMNAETWRKRPILSGSSSQLLYSCGEVELVARLRAAGYEAFWISEWSGFAPVAEWKGYCVTRNQLRETLPEVWAIDRRIRTSEPSLGLRGGHPDIVAWRPEMSCVYYAEYKGPGDTINPKQNSWVRAMYASGVAASYVAVAGTVIRAGH